MTKEKEYDSNFLRIVDAEDIQEPPPPLANYVATRRVGNVLYVSGQGPLNGKEIVSTGRLGAGVSIEDGQKAARLTGLNLLYNVRDALGTLDNVRVHYRNRWDGELYSCVRGTA